jgi:uncharacterized metal-binding protein YceD (DUF177 family)
MNKQTKPAPEFSRPIHVADLNGERFETEIEADAGERAALATRFGVLSIDSLTATVVLVPNSDGSIVEVTARFSAKIVQSCVVTLDPVENTVEGTVEVVLAEDTGDGPRVVEIDLTEGEPPEAFVDGVIDIGEVVAEHMGLEIDPFPRSPGAQFTYDAGDRGKTETDDKPRESPFSILEKLKGR